MIPISGGCWKIIIKKDFRWSDTRDSREFYSSIFFIMICLDIDFCASDYKGAVAIVIKQAELMSNRIKPKEIVYDFKPRTELLMAAEESVPYDTNETENNE